MGAQAPAPVPLVVAPAQLGAHRVEPGARGLPAAPLPSHGWGGRCMASPSRLPSPPCPPTAMAPTNVDPRGPAGWAEDPPPLKQAPGASSRSPCCVTRPSHNGVGRAGGWALDGPGEGGVGARGGTASSRPMVRLPRRVAQRLWCWAAAAKLVVPPSPGAGGPACRHWQLANELTFWTRWRGWGGGGIRAGGPRRWP